MKSLRSNCAGLSLAGLLVLAVLGCEAETEEPEVLSNSQYLPPPSALTRTFGNRFCRALAVEDEPCEQWLRVSAETDDSAAAASNPGRLTTLVVSGLFSDCVSRWFGAFGESVAALKAEGYDITVLKVGGRLSIAENAEAIKRAISQRARSKKPLLLIGYSKGANDILEALTDPFVSAKVSAAVTLGGAVYGSDLIARLPAVLHTAIEQAPFPGCQRSDSAVMDHLSPDHRRNYMANWVAPKDVAFYSVVGLPSNERVSRLLAGAHQALLRDGIANDGQVGVSGATVAGAGVLAYLNADHWAMALPIEANVLKVVEPLVDQNRFPRKALLKAVIDAVDAEI